MKKAQTISNFRLNEEFDLPFIIKSAEVNRTKTNTSDYLKMWLMDQSGLIMAIMFDVGDSARELRPGDVVRVQGKVDNYQGIRNLKVKFLSVEENPDKDLINSLKRSLPKETIVEIKNSVEEHVKQIDDKDLQQLMNSVFNSPEVEDLFYSAPASEKNHQPYVGGFAEHTLTVMDVAVEMGKIYKLNLDVIRAGVILHDIGKLFCYEWDVEIRMSDRGRLVDHMIVGTQFLSSVFMNTPELEKFPREIRYQIEHIMASHHGVSNSSPVSPQSKEAMVIHVADQIDFEITRMDEFLKGSPIEDGFSSFDTLHGSRYYVPREGPEVEGEKK